MPRKSTASKSTATAPRAPRKTRTRKVTPAAVKTVTSPTPEAKPVEMPKATTVTTFQGGKVIAKELMRPTAPLIQFKDYRRDAINRWNIHRYEIQQLGKDFKKFFNFVQPLHSEMVNRIKTVEL